MMIEKQLLVLAGALSLVAAACSSEAPSAGIDTGVPGAGGGAGGIDPGAGGAASTAGAEGVGMSGSGGGAPTDPKVCIEGIPATSQVPRLLNHEYDNVVYDLLGVETLTTSNGDAPSALLNDDSDGPMNMFAWNAYNDAAEKISSEVISGPNKSRFIGCDPATSASCYEDTIRAFGRLAFRRPLTDEEVASFLALTTIEPAGTPDEIAEAILYAFLVSPSFIMVPELAAEPEGAAFKRSSHELATRLSLMLWGSIPDAELNAAADAGQLTTQEQILAQAQRMVQVREKAGQQIAAAHRAYLGMDLSSSHWWKADHDQTLYPNYSDDSKPAMAAELDAFFEEVAFAGGSFKDLFLSNVGFVNQQTAPLYGLDSATYGAELTQVEFDAALRPGFLTRAGFLSSFSNFDATSPILRGAFITVNLIGVNPGAPDPDALMTPIPEGEYQTRRQQIEALTSPAACSGCHGAFVNPPGFVLETFDAVGSLQTQDPLGGEIDASATVTFSDGSKKPISTPLEMMQGIASSPIASRIYAEKLVSFAFRRLPNSNDACVVDELNTKLTAGGVAVVNLFADLAQADSFRLRTVGN